MSDNIESAVRKPSAIAERADRASAGAITAVVQQRDPEVRAASPEQPSQPPTPPVSAKAQEPVYEDANVSVRWDGSRFVWRSSRDA